MQGQLLDASRRYPITLPNGDIHTLTVHLNRVIDHPNFEIGDYSYYSDHQPAEDHAYRIAPYLYPGAPEKLIIGRFVQIAAEVRFVTSSANHSMDGFSTYPFSIFSPQTIMAYAAELEGTGRDTVVGHDVWLGYRALVLPGVTIGSGAIVGAGAVVAKDVPPYAVVGGNPARVLRMRFDEATVDRLLEIAWWNWDVEEIVRKREAIAGADLKALAG